MRKKPAIPLLGDRSQPYVMGIADKLSDDPMLRQLLGPRFKVICGLQRRRQACDVLISRA